MTSQDIMAYLHSLEAIMADQTTQSQLLNEQLSLTVRRSSSSTLEPASYTHCAKTPWITMSVGAS
jgi:hypothetical protein